MVVTHAKFASLALVLLLACASACTCPQTGSGRQGRALGSGQSDPSGGSLAFFGSLKSFFASSASEDANGRSCTDADLSDSSASTTSATPAGTKAGHAAVSIR
jgi:hypothetical protein